MPAPGSVTDSSRPLNSSSSNSVGMRSIMTASAAFSLCEPVLTDGGSSSSISSQPTNCMTSRLRQRELTNLIDDPAARDARSRLHGELLRWMDRTRDPFRGYYWLDRPWDGGSGQISWQSSGMTRQREHEEYEPRQLDYETGMDMVNAVRRK